MFYFHFKDKIYIITSGYMKKQEKTDKREVAKALKLKQQFLEENNADS
jgi:phage-related protein